MSKYAFQSYLRHGRKFDVDNAYWKAAASDLDGTELRQLAAELEVKLPRRWANRPSDPAPQAGSAANKSPDRPDALTPESVSSEGRTRTCKNGDGRALGPMNTTGLCRRCYQRELMRERRAALRPAVCEETFPPVGEW